MTHRMSAETRERIAKLAEEGLGYRAIADQISREAGKNISHMTIKRVMGSDKKITEKILNRDVEVQDNVKKRIIDSCEQLRKVYYLLEDLVKEAQVTREFKLKAIQQMLSAIRLSEEIMGQFRGVQIKQAPGSKLEIVQVIINNLNEMEKKGDIKILNPKLRIVEVDKDDRNIYGENPGNDAGQEESKDSE